MTGLSQPCGCISWSIHPVSISLNSHPWCLSQPHPQNRHQYLTPSRKEKKINSAKAPPVTPHLPFLQRCSTQRQAAGAISSRATRCQCNAEHRCIFFFFFFSRGFGPSGSLHASWKPCTSPRAGCELCILLTGKHGGALLWAVSWLSTWQKK